MFHTITLTVALAWSAWIADRSAAPRWVDSLPEDVRKAVLWQADHEEGTLHDWQYDNPKDSGGGIFNTGTADEAVAEVASSAAFTGRYGMKATIRNAYRCRNGKKAVRLMRWTDKPWDQGGQEFPTEAYYSVWMMVPENYNPNKEPPWDPGDGGWWNVFQFTSYDKAHESQPVWVLNLLRDDASGRLRFHFYTKYNTPQFRKCADHEVPVGKWFHIEAFYQCSGRNREDGRIVFWLNGQELLSAGGVTTRLHEGVVWGIGNYTDHIDGGAVSGTASVYFDDAVVSTKPVHPFAAAFLRGRTDPRAATQIPKAMGCPSSVSDRPPHERPATTPRAADD